MSEINPLEPTSPLYPNNTNIIEDNFDNLNADKEEISNKGQANGYAPLGADTKISSTYLPSYVDDVIEVNTYGDLPVTGETGKVYVVLTGTEANRQYRWSGTIYVEIKDSGETTASMGALINGSSNKTTPVDADVFSIRSSITGFLEKVTWANIKATLKTYFDTLYVKLSGDQTINGIKTFGSFLITPSSAPTTDYQVANKKYVDDNASSGGGSEFISTTTITSLGATTIPTGCTKIIASIDLVNNSNVSYRTNWDAWLDINKIQSKLRASQYGNTNNGIQLDANFSTMQITSSFIGLTGGVSTISIIYYFYT